MQRIFKKIPIVFGLKSYVGQRESLTYSWDVVVQKSPSTDVLAWGLKVCLIYDFY